MIHVTQKLARKIRYCCEYIFLLFNNIYIRITVIIKTYSNTYILSISINWIFFLIMAIQIDVFYSAKKVCSILLVLQTIWYVVLLLLPSQQRFRLSSLYFECHKAHGIHNKSLEQFWKYFDMFPKIFTSFAVAKVFVLWFLRRGGSFFKEISKQ